MARANSSGLKKKALKEGYSIAYVDEAAFSYFPYVQKTYHRKGQRCIVKHGPLRGGIQSISMVTTRGRIHLAQLPPYSPQLNADEQVHSLIKTHYFKNRLFTGVNELNAWVQ